MTDYQPSKAPEHWVARIAAMTRPPLNPRGGSAAEQHAAHDARVRVWLDAMWAEAYAVGAAKMFGYVPHTIALPHDPAAGPPGGVGPFNPKGTT